MLQNLDLSLMLEWHRCIDQLKLANSVFNMVRRIESMLLKGERV